MNLAPRNLQGVEKIYILFLRATALQDVAVNEA
jgi:hypothetical protein